MQRRALLQALSLSPLAGVSAQLLAAPAQGQKLLVVFLRGAYDSASLLVPYSSGFYYESRPRIAIPRPGEAGGALRLDARWALHPALASSVMPLVARGQVAFLPFAGTDDVSRSHFETQDGIELGQPLGQSRDYTSGFLNRLAGVLNSGSSATRQAMAFTEQLPMVLRGDARAANMALGGAGKPLVDEHQSRVIQAMYSGTALDAAVSEGFAVREDVLRAVRAEMDAASRNAISAKGFEQVARRMARLMRERYDIGFVDVGGWDTHVGQGAATGYLANRLEELGRGLVAFAQELGASASGANEGDQGAWRDTVVVVVSEFGRTFRENGNGGTDHGHGTVYWLLGGGLSAQAGGRVIGEQAEVSPKGLFQNRDAPVLNEYRAVLGGLFARMYGLSAAQVAQVFPGVQARDLGIV